MDGKRNIPSVKNLFPINNFKGRSNATNDESENYAISQYVSEVLDFSSQYGSDSSVSYTAYNLAGKPSNYPDYGDFPQAFTMRTYGKWWKEVPSCQPEYMPQNKPKIVSHDYIDIAFETAVYPTNVDIFETYNPGAVVRIWALNTDDHHKCWSLLWEGALQFVEKKARKFSPAIASVNFKTRILRIEFNHSLLDYYFGLDAVLLTGVTKPAKSNPVNSPISLQVIKRNLHNIPFNAQPHDLTKLLSDYLKDTAQPKIDHKTVTSSVTFGHLPNETLLKILGYLDLASLCKVSQVSRALNNLATDEMLYVRLTLKPYWNKMCDEALYQLRERCARLQRLDLSWCGGHGLITTLMFENFITTTCQNLTHIRLNCCKFVRNGTIKALAHTCPNVVELGLRNCVEVNQVGFLHLTALSRLTTLDLYRTSITGSCLVLVLKANPNLQHLNIGSCPKVDNTDDVARTLGEYNPRLVSLDLWKTVNLTQAGVRALSQCSMLEELDLGWCLSQSVPVESLASLARGCPRLRKLFLTAVRGITDKDLEPFMTCCPNLEQLDLMGVHSITSDGCYRLLANLERLRLLDLSFCYQVSDSTVEYWRPKFPEVALKSSSQSQLSHPPQVVYF